MKVGIVGTTGYIGQKLKEYMVLNKIEIIEINRTQCEKTSLDLRQSGNFDYSLLNSCKYIVFTAAISSPDYCENNYPEAEAVNVLGTKYFIEEAIKRRNKVIFLSSDSVYGKDRGTPFTENSDTAPTTAYGNMKKSIEDLFSNSYYFKAIRLSYVLSGQDKFLKYLNSCKNNKEIAKIYHPFYRNCVTLDEVMESIVWLIENWNAFKSPFLNICGRELISRLNIIDELNRIDDEKIRYEIIEPPFEFFKIRPQVTEMKSLYLDQVLKTLEEPFSSRLQKQLLK